MVSVLEMPRSIDSIAGLVMVAYVPKSEWYASAEGTAARMFAFAAFSSARPLNPR